MIYFTSDIHLGQVRALEVLTNRKFQTLDEMNEKLIDEYNCTVPKDAFVIILGDLIMGKKYDNVPKFLPQLNGRKILIRGNHDLAFDDIRPGKQEAAEKLYLDNGILKLYDGCVSLEQVLIDNNEPIPYDVSFIKLSHFPFKGIPDHVKDRDYEIKYEHLCVNDDGESWLFHGHQHSLISMSRERMYDVGVDSHNYKPVSLDDIVSSIHEYRRNNEGTAL